ncbi:MAG: CHASE2 domain-containing protein [Cyanophyceae cyanobacterium]
MTPPTPPVDAQTDPSLPLWLPFWNRRLSWGLFWGMGWSTLLSMAATTPGLYRLERDLQSLLLVQRGSQGVADEVVVIGIDGRVESTAIEGESTNPSADFLLDRTNYAALTLQLLEEAEVEVVVLNLPSSFVVPQRLGNDDLDAPLRQIIQQYPNRLVLATRSSESFRQAEINIFNHFLPFSSLLLEYLIPPEDVQGVVQFQTDPDGILRQAQLSGDFRRRDSQRTQTFVFAEALALTKLKPDIANRLFQAGSTVLFNPLGAEQRIPQIPIEEVCTHAPLGSCEGALNPDLRDQLRGKVVLVGFVGGYPETFPVTTATGSQIPAVELQAQILSSLLRQEFFQNLPRSIEILIIHLVGMGTGLVLSSQSSAFIRSSQRLLRQPGPRALRLSRPQVYIVVWGMAMGAYAGVGVAQFLLWRTIWPLVLPFLTVGLTTVSTIVTMVLIHNRERLQAQQTELEQMRRAEQEAAVDQARKLLYRVATDIHDQELQELKLVMDDLEGLQWKQDQGIPIESKVYDDLLYQLEQMGRGIRNQLNDVRTLATKLHVSPTLREGLHRGIETYLESLVVSGSLTLPIEKQLYPLQESSTGTWIDHREDIMRFFREALANVISHVQPPKGDATFVTVKLFQSGSQCYLEVSNDGTEYAPNKRGGYGTKAMNTIALDLPQGSWQRIRRPDGITHVELQWQMPSPKLSHSEHP